MFSAVGLFFEFNILLLGSVGEQILFTYYAVCGRLVISTNSKLELFLRMKYLYENLY